MGHLILRAIGRRVLAVLPVVAVVLGGTGAGAQAAPAPSTCPGWDLAAEFRTSPNQANPNPDNRGNAAVWYFLGWAPGSPPALLQVFASSELNISGLEGWQGPFLSSPNFQLPEVGVNATGAVQTYKGVTWPAGVVNVHPDPTHAAAVVWRSPVAGTVGVTGGVTDLDPRCGNGITWLIGHGGKVLAVGAIPNGGAQTFASGIGGASLSSIAVAAGDILYVAVGAKQGDFGCDSTELDLTITPH